MTAKARIRAIDRFIKGCREDGIYDDLQAACVMAGWDSLAGALTPLKGAAPTNNGLSVYDRGGIGIAGDGTSYLNTNRLNSSDGQEDKHLACFVTSPNLSTGENVIGSLVRSPSLSVSQIYVGGVGSPSAIYINSSTFNTLTYDGSAGLFGASRTGTDLTARVSGVSSTLSSVTNGNHALPTYVFCRNDAGTANSFCDGSIAFFSIGSATDLALLDARVSTLMADLRAIEETGFDRDALAYIRAVEAADGAYLETSVKIAINNLVAGLKADGLWDAIGSSCLLCGPRTLAGALVPLRGDAPTAYGFVDGDYSRTDGITGDGTSYLDSNRAGNSDPQNDSHAAFYITTQATVGSEFLSNRDTDVTAGYISVGTNLTDFFFRFKSTGFGTVSGMHTGFVGMSRSLAASFTARCSGSNSTISNTSGSVSSNSVLVFDRQNTSAATDATLAFYSIGTAINLAKLDTRTSSYVTAIGEAL